MKQTTTPAIKYIDGQPFVRVIDLGHQWHTNTSNILAIGKRHHVPEEQLRRIDGRVWCSFQGLRYRVAATKHGSSIAGRIREFLDSQEEKTEPKPTAATPTDLGTVALIADARHTASEALKIANLADKSTDNLYEIAIKHRERVDYLEQAISANTGRIAALEKFKPSRDHVARHQSAAATVVNEKNTGRIQKLEKLAETLDSRMAAAENDSYRRFDTVMTRCHHVEQRQGDSAVQLTAVKRSVWLLRLAVAALAVVQVVGGIFRMARRR